MMGKKFWEFKSTEVVKVEKPWTNCTAEKKPLQWNNSTYTTEDASKYKISYILGRPQNSIFQGGMEEYIINRMIHPLVSFVLLKRPLNYVIHKPVIDPLELEVACTQNRKPGF